MKITIIKDFNESPKRCGGLCFTGKRDDSLFENYRWKKEFLELNKNTIVQLSP